MLSCISFQVGQTSYTCILNVLLLNTILKYELPVINSFLEAKINLHKTNQTFLISMVSSSIFPSKFREKGFTQVPKKAALGLQSSESASGKEGPSRCPGEEDQIFF